MSWAFLLVSFVGLALTGNTFRPRRGWLTIPSFFASWLVNELALYTIFWQAVATAFFVRAGALTDWPGRVGLALTAGSWMGVLILWIRGRRTESTMRKVLGEWAPEGTWPRVPRWKAWVPFSPRRLGVRRTRDVEYGRVGKKRLLLDVYAPAERRGRRPAIVQIHGGAWVIGDKREQGLVLLNHLAANGWVGFNVNYRLSPRATFPDHLVDIKRAIAWIREHADEYDVDPRFLCVTGGSAGGHLTALVALTANDPAYQPGFEDADTSVQGAVPFYGIYCLVDRLGIYPEEFFSAIVEPLVMKARRHERPDDFRAASPIDKVHADAPPMLIVHGEADSLAPVHYARHFAAELKQKSKAPVLYAELAGAQHAFDLFASARAACAVEGVERFLAGLYERHQKETERRSATAA